MFIPTTSFAWLSRLPLSWRRRVLAWLETLELLGLQRVIAINRAARRLRLWAQPIRRWLWIMPASYVLGLVGGFMLIMLK